MTRNRLNMLLACLTMVVVAAAGFFLGVQPQLARASASDAERATVEATNATKTAELARLKATFDGADELRADHARLEASVPSTASMPSFYKQLDAAGTSASVEITSVTTGDAVAYAPATDGAAAAASTEATAGATASPSPSATPSPSASAATGEQGAAVPGAPATDSRITTSNFSLVPVTVSVTGTFAQALDFATGIQSTERLYLVDSVTATSATSDSSGDGDAADAGSAMSWTFAGNVFVLSSSTAVGDTAKG